MCKPDHQQAAKQLRFYVLIEGDEPSEVVKNLVIKNQGSYMYVYIVLVFTIAGYPTPTLGMYAFLEEPFCIPHALSVSPLHTAQLPPVTGELYICQGS